MHKTINWASLAGVLLTAALGYFADQRSNKADHHMASGAAIKLAVFEAQLNQQHEEIARLREAVAVLRAGHRVSPRIDALLLDDEPHAVGAAPAAGAADAIKKQLLEE